MSILVDRPSDHVMLLTLNRPEVLNATSVADIEELDAIVARAEADGDVRCLVLTGAGRAFCAGNDIHEMSGADDAAMAAMEMQRREPTFHWATTTLPTIAAVNGVAYGYGAILAVGADLRVGCAESVFKVTATKYGSANLTWNLPAVVGFANARDVLLTARPVGGDEAYRIGLLNRLVGRHEVVAAALSLATEIAAHPPVGTRRINALLNEVHGTSMRTRFEREHDLQMQGIAGNNGASVFAGFLDGSSQRRDARGPGGTIGSG